ncbi:MAG: hypothetical protein MAG795_00189 [Candidatus Woesearchaeota archaeon]|nr:hypothetical protein [Candidatus Woesearchaeota archaeon]
MPKKCIICEEPAQFGIKCTRDYYCRECAKQSFSDLGLLKKLE